MPLRKVSDVWAAVASQKPGSVTSVDWKQSYDGTKAALSHVGFELVTTRDEFEAIPIPVRKTGLKNYGQRNVEVRRDDHVSSPTQITNLLTGNSGVQTPEERVKALKLSSTKQSAKSPQGTPVNNDLENQAHLALLNLLHLEHHLHCVPLWEHRLADVAFAVNGESSQGYVADQIKTSQVGCTGEVCFHETSGHITIKTMVAILHAGMSLTLIGKDTKQQPDVVWLFHGQDAVDMLKSFPDTQPFRQRLHLKIPSHNPFTIKVNDARYRFDIGKSAGQIARLRDRKIEIAHVGMKKPLTFWNEDESQIPSFSHRIEHESFKITREACGAVGSIIDHNCEDNYTPVDFRLNDRSRIQDKVGDKRFHLRHPGGYPYNPDSFDILQISNIKTKEVYAIPLRYIKDGIVCSTLSSSDLMKTYVAMSVEWKTKVASYKFDLNKATDVQRYVNVCDSAYLVPALTNKAFFPKMLEDNVLLFGASLTSRGKKSAKVKKLVLST